MKLLQIGMEKSGNLWLWKTIESILARAGLEKKRFIQKQPIYDLMENWPTTIAGARDIDSLEICKNVVYYYFYPFFYMSIDNLDDYMNSVSHVWSHSHYNKGSEKVLPRFDKIVYIVRDPRDAFISTSRHVFNPLRFKYLRIEEENPEQYFEKSYRLLARRWAQHVGQYLRRRDALNIHFIFYERLLFDFDRELQGLLDYLNIQLGENDKKAIKEEVSFSSMQREYSDHLRKGTYGQWLQILTTKQKKEILRITGPLIQLLNYSTNRKGGLPAVPKEINDKEIGKMISRSNWPTIREATDRFYKIATN